MQNDSSEEIFLKQINWRIEQTATVRYRLIIN